MEKIWNDLYAELLEQAPELARSFRAPVTEDKLVDIEILIKQRLPEDLRHMYLIHDGCDYDHHCNATAIGLFGRYQWLPLKELHEVWIQNFQSFDDTDPYTCDEDEWGDLPIRPWTSLPPYWIPIGVIPNYSTCSINIDLQPSTQGRIGQIVADNIFAISRGIFASSLSDYFTSLTEGLKQRLLRVSIDADTQDQYWGYANGEHFRATGQKHIY